VRVELLIPLTAFSRDRAMRFIFPKKSLPAYLAIVAGLKSQQKSPAIVALSMTLTLAGCGPSADEVAKAVGRRDISDVSCAAANGQPGYVCTFKYLNNDLTRRFIKSDDGGWSLVN
jgi:hypothetical protein